MVASLLIIGFSLILLVYWFRYTCILILRNDLEHGVSERVAYDNQLSFLEVQGQLKQSREIELDVLHRSLQRDFQVLTYLLDHAASLGLHSFEDRLLVLDYKLMKAWYRVTKAFAPAQARLALSERAAILSLLANRMGEQAGVRAEA
ncbi:MAG TPA: hypothetical protein VG675_18935 [Bryobacteraceae bacterium]|nr:hypothetical protein [Bryobacteraceae bacterium]